VGIAEEVGSAIRGRREQLGLSQKELAKAIGKHEQMITRYENGKASIPWPVLDQIAEALKTSPIELFAEAREIGETTAVFEDMEVSRLRPMAVREQFRVYTRSSLRRLPQRAIMRVNEYLNKLEDLGLNADELDEAEQFLVNGAYNKINSREPGEKSEDDLILDIDAAWQFVRDVVNRNGKIV
jgi:transcriptional regulator with XRE-family HTH domain